MLPKKENLLKKRRKEEKNLVNVSMIVLQIYLNYWFWICLFIWHSICFWKLVTIQEQKRLEIGPKLEQQGLGRNLLVLIKQKACNSRMNSNKNKYYAKLQRKPPRIIVTSSKVYPHNLSRRHLDIPILTLHPLLLIK